MGRKAEIILEYQNLIDGPPAPIDSLREQSCSNDRNTVNGWRDTWIANIAANHKKFGSFKERGLGQLWGTHQYMPCIIAGSGPSLKGNAHQLKNRGGIPLVSCLHNFHFLEDNGTPADYYVTLDAGKVTIEEVSEGGSKTEDEYWALTEQRTLLAYIGSPPELLAKWRGKIYFFDCPVPDKVVTDATEALEPFNTIVSTGGNVLGACLYIAKAFFGCNPIAFMGADFSFSYMNKFHAWDSKYDKDLGTCVAMVDIYGVKVKSWQSYANFKSWFDWVCATKPGLWVNCSEGGCLGSYPQGNMLQVRPMDLVDFIQMYHMHNHMKYQSEHPEDNSQDKKLILF